MKRKRLEDFYMLDAFFSIKKSIFYLTFFPMPKITISPISLCIQFKMTLNCSLKSREKLQAGYQAGNCIFKGKHAVGKSCGFVLIGEFRPSQAFNYRRGIMQI